MVVLHIQARAIQHYNVWVPEASQDTQFIAQLGEVFLTARIRGAIRGNLTAIQGLRGIEVAHALQAQRQVVHGSKRVRVLGAKGPHARLEVPSTQGAPRRRGCP